MRNDISKIPLIILCAGKSSRMGTPKGLLEIHGIPLVLWHFDNFVKIGGKLVLLVLGFECEKYFSTLPWLKNSNDCWLEYPRNKNLKIRLVINQNPEPGQFSSILSAFRTISEPDYSYSFLTPVDTPCPGEQVWQALYGSTPGKKACVPTFHGMGGHPVLLSLDFIKEIFKTSLSSPDARLDKKIKLLPKKNLAKVPVTDERILLNLNNKEDFENYKIFYAK